MSYLLLNKTRQYSRQNQSRAVGQEQQSELSDFLAYMYTGIPKKVKGGWTDGQTD